MEAKLYELSRLQGEGGNKQKSGSMCVKWVFLLSRWQAESAWSCNQEGPEGKQTLCLVPSGQRQEEEGGGGGEGTKVGGQDGKGGLLLQFQRLQSNI